MIAKITVGSDVGGCLEYQDKDNYASKEGGNKSNNDAKEPLSKLLHTQNMTSLVQNTNDKKQIKSAFDTWNLKNTRVQKNVFHASLNFPIEDNPKLNSNKLIDIANEFMLQMGYEQVPYAIYEHNDTHHKHVHIVSSRIDNDGKRINDFQESRKAIAICRDIEQRFGLTLVQGEHKKDSKEKTGEARPQPTMLTKKKFIQAAIQDVLSNGKVNSIKELQAKLETKSVIMFINEKHGKKLVSFQVLEDGKPSSVFFGSKLQKNLYSDLAKKIERNEKERIGESHDQRVKDFVKDLKAQPNQDSIQAIKSLLSKYQLSIQLERKTGKQGGTPISFKILEAKESIVSKLKGADLSEKDQLFYQLEKADAQLSQNLEKDSRLRNYHYELSFTSLSKRGEVVYHDSSYKKQQRQYLLRVLLEKCPSLLQPIERRQFEDYTENQRTFSQISNKLNFDKQQTKSKLHALALYAQARGLNYKFSYYRGADKTLQIQRIEYFKADKSQAFILKDSDLMKGQKQYAPLVSLINQEINELENKIGKEKFQDYMKTLNAMPNPFSPEEVRFIKFIDSLSKVEFANNLHKFSHSIDDKIFEQLSFGKQIMFSKYKQQEQGREDFKKASPLYRQFAQTNTHLITNFQSQELDENKIFDER